MHFLGIFTAADKPKTPEDIDKIICAEIPDPEKAPILFDHVMRHMLHNKCGEHHIDGMTRPCMKDGECSKYFPKEISPFTVGKITKKLFFYKTFIVFTVFHNYSG